jgi:hypothetical protein
MSRLIVTTIALPSIAPFLPVLDDECCHVLDALLRPDQRLQRHAHVLRRRHAFVASSQLPSALRHGGLASAGLF